MSSSPKIAVIYHKHCLDGFSAAWVLWKKFGDRAVYYPAVHQNPFPKEIKGKDVYMVDFCYSEKVMSALKREANKVIVLDHHISQKEAVKISDDYVFDIKRSGSSIAWSYIFPKKKMPKLISFVEDNDLWNFDIPKAREVIASLDTEKFDFKRWSKLVLELETAEKRKKHIEKGSHILEYQKAAIDSVFSSAEKARFEGKECLVVNSPMLASEIGHVLAKAAKGGVGIVWVKKGDKIKVSLRSNGKVDVAKIASKYNGGGHKAAAGFVFQAKKGGLEFPWKSLK